MDDSSDTLDDLRQKGNHEFQQGNLDKALAFYTAAIEQAQQENSVSVGVESAASSMLVILLCNRSACHFQLLEYESAKQDAERAWTLSQHSAPKAAYRLAKTLLAILDDQSAAASDAAQGAAQDYCAQAIQVLTTALAALSSTSQHQPTTEQTALQELLNLAQKRQQQGSTNALSAETTIVGVNRPISIREFIKGESLGVGNFSEIIIVTHKVTSETFALKILEKKQAADLAKRQHPNVYNEIAMEARVLLERLPPHPRIIQMYHSFQDYYNLYYLMELHGAAHHKNIVHTNNMDLWSQMRYNNKMVGTHSQMTKAWLYQLIDALEHIHSHGIVHRDLKPENVLLDKHWNVVVIDFGTAKDLIQTDLNGPEFVGTPDFMSPEAVTGGSGALGNEHATKGNTKSGRGKGRYGGATHAADLWALGAMAYILHTGSCPFWSPSPYLTFLRIQRGLLPRNQWAIPDQDAWDFCRELMQPNPNDRLGADCFKVTSDSTSGNKVSVNKGYDVLRNHRYFQNVMIPSINKSISTDMTVAKAHSKPIVIMPSLQDLCIRAVAEMVQRDAVNLDICDQHPPGDGSSHDMMRLDSRQRCLVLHVLDKLKVFREGDETRVLQRFFLNDVDYLRAKVRAASRDFVGLTQMNDDEYKPLSHRGSQDPYAKKDDPEPTKIVILSNPYLLRRHQAGLTTPEEEKNWLKGWKNCIAHINKQRPKVVVACGLPPLGNGQKLTDKYWKFLSRVRDSIPVVWNDGSAFYTFWVNGFQGIVICKAGFAEEENGLQMKWLREQMEQSRMSKPQICCFCDCDPRELPEIVIKRLARGRVLCLFGVSEDDLDYTVTYEPNERVGDDNISVKSTDSQEDMDDAWTMRIVASGKNGINWLTVDEKEEWKTAFELID